MNGEIQRIEQLVKERNWKMADFKRKIGVTPPQYNNWKSRGVPMEWIVKLAELFNVDANWLATGKESKVAATNNALNMISKSGEKLSSVKMAVLTELCNLFERDIDFDDITMLHRVIQNTSTKYHHA